MADMTDPHDSNQPTTWLIPCPRCGNDSDSIKSIDSAILLFVVLGWSLQKSKIIACPTCCQKALLGKAAVNLVTANVFWPIIILPLTAIGLRKTTIPGHDADVLSTLNLPVINGGGSREPRPLAEAFPLLSRVIGGAQLLLSLVLGWFSLVGISVEYFRDESAETRWSLIGALMLTVVAYLVVTGVARLLLRVPRFPVRVAMALACGALSWLSMGTLVAVTWHLREPGFAKVAIESPYSYEGENYSWRVPPQFWTVAPLQSLAEHAYESYRIESLLVDLRAFHAHDPAFAPIIKLLEEKQSKASSQPAAEALPSKAS